MPASVSARSAATKQSNAALAALDCVAFARNDELGRLPVLGEVGQLPHDLRRAHQPFLRRLPCLEKYHLHVGPYLGRLTMLPDEINEAVRLREFVVAESNHDTLRPGIDLLDIGAAAIALDRRDLE